MAHNHNKSTIGTLTLQFYVRLTPPVRMRLMAPSPAPSDCCCGEEIMSEHKYHDYEFMILIVTICTSHGLHEAWLPGIRGLFVAIIAPSWLSSCAAAVHVVGVHRHPHHCRPTVACSTCANINNIASRCAQKRAKFTELHHSFVPYEYLCAQAAHEHAQQSHDQPFVLGECTAKKKWKRKSDRRRHEKRTQTKAQTNNSAKQDTFSSLGFVYIYSSDWVLYNVAGPCIECAERMKESNGRNDVNSCSHCGFVC